MPIVVRQDLGSLVPVARVHVIIPTHTPRHLAACLCGIAWQTRPPETVVVTCDTDDPAIGATLEEFWPRAAAMCRGPAPRLIHTFRPHQGEARPSQVRNNGLRALAEQVRLEGWDVVIGIDGDILLSPDAVRRHLELAVAGAELTIGFRVCLDQEQTAALDVDTLLAAAAAPSGSEALVSSLMTTEAADALRRRQARYERQRMLRERLPAWAVAIAVKSHKPKVISSHFAARVSCLKAINGFDERYVEYGYEDDDLGRRAHALGPTIRTCIAVDAVPAFHLWHPSRAPRRPMNAPGYARFSQRDLTAAAERGWRDPMPQPRPVCRVISPDTPVPISGAV